LLWSANHLVTGAANCAKYFHISPLIIGLTIVALGTSAPEIFVGISAAMQGKTNLAIGNAIGSNIANIGLVLGFTALLMPLKLQSSSLKREYPLLLLIMLFTYALMMDGYFSVTDGSLFLIGLIALLIYLTQLAKKTSKKDALLKEFQVEIPQQFTIKYSLLSLVIGFIVLPLSAKLLVHGAVGLATWLGVSEFIIGLTIVAIGTSLPEVATSLVGAFKGEFDIAVGNILGSNMFNLLAVLAFPGIIHPDNINKALLRRDIPVMFALTLILFCLSYFFKTKGSLNRVHGGLLLLIYCCYIFSIIFIH